jgi:hypothetical protein
LLRIIFFKRLGYCVLVCSSWNMKIPVHSVCSSGLSHNRALS